MIRAVAGYGIQVPRWEVQSLINSLVCWKGKSMAIVSVGIDLAKNVLPFTASPSDRCALYPRMTAKGRER